MKSQLTKIFSVILVVVVLLVVISFVSQGGVLSDKGVGNTTTKDVIKIGSFSKSISYAPYHVAIRNGWFEEIARKHGTTVKFQELQTLPSINEAFATRNIDIIFEAEPPAIIGSAGIDMKINGIWVADLQEIIVPTNSSINHRCRLER